MEKKQIGNILHYFSLSMYFIPIAPWLMREKIAFLTTNRLTRISLLFVSGGCFMYAISGLLTDEVGVRGRIIGKTKQPGYFWYIFGLHCFFGLVTFIASFFYAE